MIRKTTSAALLLAAMPAMAAPKEMPQGKRDAMSMKDSKASGRTSTR